MHSRIFNIASIATIAEEWFPYIVMMSTGSLRSLKSGFHMIAELFIFSDRSDRSDHMETRFKGVIVLFVGYGSVP